MNTATTIIYPLSLHDALPIYGLVEPQNASGESFGDRKLEEVIRKNQSRPPAELLEQMLSEIRAWQPASLRSEEHTSELQSLTNLVCRLLLEKKKQNKILVTE